MSQLAIVIPAYKVDFLEKTLSSLKNQSCQDFSVYIGDDASPFDLYDIVSKFESDLDIHYFRFPSNLGGTNLVGQWERCINLCQNEKWINLFSDDDIMEKDCIRHFYEANIPDNINVVHYDINLIDKAGSCISECSPFPEQITAESFFNSLFRRELVARMPEFIFRASFLKKGLIHFDLAWRADTALVISAGRQGGIKTIKGDHCKVLWRISNSNISSIGQYAMRKNDANIDFFNWIHDSGLPIIMSRLYLLKTIVFSLEWRNTKGFIYDGLKATRHIKFAKHLRIFMILFLLYRIPYHWIELRKV